MRRWRQWLQIWKHTTVASLPDARRRVRYPLGAAVRLTHSCHHHLLVLLRHRRPCFTPRFHPNCASTALAFHRAAQHTPRKPEDVTTIMMSFFSSKKVALPDHNCVLPHALKIPALEKLVGKRVVLASNSPRRRDILRTFVGSVSVPLLRNVRLTEIMLIVAGPRTGDRALDVRGDAPVRRV